MHKVKKGSENARKPEDTEKTSLVTPGGEKTRIKQWGKLVMIWVWSKEGKGRQWNTPKHEVGENTETRVKPELKVQKPEIIVVKIVIERS